MVYDSTITARPSQPKPGKVKNMLPLRLTLCSGLLAHKIVWEIMRKRQDSQHTTVLNKSLAIRIVKKVKIVALSSILIQALALNIIPIRTNNPYITPLGLIMFLSGLFVAIFGRVQLGNNWSNIEDNHVKDNHEIVQTGLYRYMRHPIYLGDVLMLVGLELALRSWLVVLAAIPALISYSRVVKEEEHLLRSVPEYQVYRSRTKMFIPGLL